MAKKKQKKNKVYKYIHIDQKREKREVNNLDASERSVIFFVAEENYPR